MPAKTPQVKVGFNYMPSGIYKRTKPVWNKGKTSPFKGKYHTEITKKKLSEANFRRYENGEKFGFQKGHKINVGKIAWNKGKHHTEETKKKIREANKGKKRSEETKRRLSEIVTGFKHSEETKRKIGEAKRGEKNWNWQGGITSKNQKIKDSIEFRLWRESVFVRDNWTCQKTGIRGGKIHSHHILNFAQCPELRTSIENGITFSKKAHEEFHKKYGTKNNTREQLNEFLRKEN
jgi:hypothetical protein